MLRPLNGKNEKCSHFNNTLMCQVELTLSHIKF